ncbi:hypothetical protein [Streptomyces nigrescens]|uniref:hypothetical protein n=1 Tax=Streptomyces nigrescens TaxID=1920 RepID=UPI003F4CB133
MVGEVSGGTINCMRHGSKFDITDGSVRPRHQGAGARQGEGRGSVTLAWWPGRSAARPLAGLQPWRAGVSRAPLGPLGRSKPRLLLMPSAVAAKTSTASRCVAGGDAGASVGPASVARRRGWSDVPGGWDGQCRDVPGRDDAEGHRPRPACPPARLPACPPARLPACPQVFRSATWPGSRRRRHGRCPSRTRRRRTPGTR